MDSNSTVTVKFQVTVVCRRVILAVIHQWAECFLQHCFFVLLFQMTSVLLQMTYLFRSVGVFISSQASLLFSRQQRVNELVPWAVVHN